MWCSGLCSSPEELFLSYTKHLYHCPSGRDIGVLLGCLVDGRDADARLAAAFDKGFEGKTAKRQGKDLVWRRWLEEGVFPSNLYREHRGSLMSMIKDPRFYQELGFSSYDNWSSFFGRMSRPRASFKQYGHFDGFLDYLIYGWKVDHLRVMPRYCFDIESMSWLWDEMARNKTQPRPSRSKLLCVVMFQFRWNPISKRPTMTLILKHSQWSHVWGDIFGGAAALAAVAKETNITLPGELYIFNNSATLDKRRSARIILEEMGCE